MNQEPGGISERDYRELSRLIHSQCGIAFPAAKRVMMETRLRKRARALGLPSLSAYCEYLHSPDGKIREAPHLIDAVTTHKTDFFREPAHFDYLVGEIVPALARRCGAGFQRPLRVWSSACSTGEEPYTIAMVLSAYAGSVAPRRYQFHIEGTDVSTPVLETARSAVYPEAAVDPVPAALRRRYLLRSKDQGRALVRMAPEIRTRVAFRQLNLMEADYGFTQPLDVIFCRNVMIYFDRSTQHSMLVGIGAVLRAGGYLVMGHSESLNGLDLRLVQVAPTVYRRPDE